MLSKLVQTNKQFLAFWAYEIDAFSVFSVLLNTICKVSGTQRSTLYNWANFIEVALFDGGVGLYSQKIVIWRGIKVFGEV